MDKDSLEYKLNFKLRSGQITQEEYDKLYEKFKKLGILEGRKQKPKRYFTEGSRNIDRIILDGPVSLSGGVSVDGPVECTSFSSSGSVSILGNLSVHGKTSISGETFVSEDVKFGSAVNVTGTLRIDGKLFALNKVSVTGNLFADQITVDSRLHVLGKIEAQNLRCSSTVKLSGVMKLGSVLAESFQFRTSGSKGEKSEVDGNIVAKQIKISAPSSRISLDLSKVGNLLDKIQIPGTSDISEIINNTVGNFIPVVMDEINNISEEIATGLASLGDLQDPGLTIQGDLRADEIVLAHVIVYGDVIGKDIKIGQNVIVHGTIRYYSTLSGNTDDMKTEQLSTE